MPVRGPPVVNSPRAAVHSSPTFDSHPLLLYSSECLVRVEDMTRACATLTLFLGLPQGSMGFASCLSSSCRPRVPPPTTALLGVWGRVTSRSSSSSSIGGSSIKSGGQTLCRVRRRRSECLMASISTSGDREAKPETEGMPAGLCCVAPVGMIRHCCCCVPQYMQRAD